MTLQESLKLMSNKSVEPTAADLSVLCVWVFTKSVLQASRAARRLWLTSIVRHRYAMGAIKDIVDLAKDLESRAKDRRDMDIIHKIQSLAFSFQSSYTDVIERDVRLVQENAELKKQLAEMQAEEFLIHRGIEFRRGKRTRDKWLGFCPKCHMPAQDIDVPRIDGPTHAVACSASCGWRVFAVSKLDEIVSEVGVWRGWLTMREAVRKARDLKNGARIWVMKRFDEAGLVFLVV
jgi:hypothetical protein